jgi:hypothetical protein
MTQGTIDRIMERFLSSPAGQALAADEARASAEDRRRAVARLAELESEGAERAKIREAAQSKATLVFESAKAALDQAATSLSEIAQASWAESWRSNSERSDLVRMLEASCATEVEQFIEEVSQAIEQAQREGISSVRVGTRSTLTGAPQRIYASNARTTNEFMEVARCVLNDAGALRLLADQTIAVTQIETLRGRLVGAHRAVVIEEVVVTAPQIVKEAK